MTRALDLDLLRTFIAIAETGSFTRAAEDVHKTQSAVSMQMRRLEDTVQKTLFVRDGRKSRLTGEGEHLLDYARRLVSLNNEAMQAFCKPEVAGLVRLGTPDDYADRLLPSALGRFSRSHPLIQVGVECLGSDVLIERVDAGALDLAVITCSNGVGAQVLRTEPLVWVTSGRHDVHNEDVLPLALSHHGCAWRGTALDALAARGRACRIAYASANSLAVATAVLEGLAVGAMAEINIRAGMRVLTEQDGFPDLGVFDIGLIRSKRQSSAADALAEHIGSAFAEFSKRHAAE